MVKCLACGKRAAVELRYAGSSLCEACFSRMFEKRVSKANRDFGMLEKGDKVAVGISGGKDSAAMLAVLSKLAPKAGFRVMPVLIDEGIAGYRNKAMVKAEALCQNLGIPLSIFTFKQLFGLSLDQIMKKKARQKDAPGACSYCGVLRRKALEKAAKGLGATKLAIGHNADDADQTLLLNILRNDWNGLSRFAPVSPGGKGVPRVRPLIYNLEKECAIYCMANGIPFYLGACPYAEDAMRGPVKDFLNGMEQERPGTKFTVLNSFLALSKALGGTGTEGAGVEGLSGAAHAVPCKECGEPSSGGSCRACRLVGSLG